MEVENSSNGPFITELLASSIALSKKAPRLDPLSSSSSSSRRFPKRLGVAELAAAAERLGASDQGDQAAYIRLLASKDFDTQKLTRSINSLDHHINKQPCTKGKLEGSNIEGYISHQNDMIILDTIYKAKARVEQDIEISQRTNWSWRQLMGSKMGIASASPSVIPGELNRILPIISIPVNDVDNTNDMATMSLSEAQDSSEKPDATADFIDLLANQYVEAPVNSNSSFGPVLPFICLRETALRLIEEGGRDEEEENGLMQYALTLELLASMTGEERPEDLLDSDETATNQKNKQNQSRPGRLFKLAFGVADPTDPALDVLRVHSFLTRGALQYLERYYEDAGLPQLDRELLNPEQFKENYRSVCWRHVYNFMRKGQLKEASEFLKEKFADDKSSSATYYLGISQTNVAADAGFILEYLLSLELQTEDRPGSSSSVGAGGAVVVAMPFDHKTLSTKCLYMKQFLEAYAEEQRDPRQAGFLALHPDHYLQAVLRLLTAVWCGGPDEEGCAGEVPGNFEEPDLESFLWAKLWLTHQKRAVAADVHGGGGRRGSRVDQDLRSTPGASPVGENFLYLTVQDDGGAAAFEEDYANSPHFYVRTLLCCHRFGEAVAYLASRPGTVHHAEAVSLCWGLLYHGLLSPHVPFLRNPRAGMPPANEELDALHQSRPVDLLTEYATCSLQTKQLQQLQQMQQSVTQKLRTVANILTLLMPPRQARRSLEECSRQEDMSYLSAASVEYARNRRKIAALSDAISGAHAAHSDAMEDLLLTVLDNVGKEGVELLAVGPYCHLSFGMTTPCFPLEVLLTRAGSRALHVNHSLPKAHFFYASAGRIPQLCAQVTNQLAITLMPDGPSVPGQLTAYQQQREFAYAAAVRLPGELQPGDVPQADELYLFNLRVLREAIDAHYRGEDEATVLGAFDQLRLSGQLRSNEATGHIPTSLFAYGEMDRTALESFFAGLDYRVRLLYNQYLEKAVFSSLRS